MEYMVSSCLVDRLASRLKEGFRLVRIASSDCVNHLTGSLLNARLFSNVLSMAFRIGFYTQNGCFDIWQIIHPLDS